MVVVLVEVVVVDSVVVVESVDGVVSCVVAGAVDGGLVVPP